MASRVTDPADTRDRLLRAARDVFAQFGYTGATTRRISILAGVNEITVFRLFGSKEALLDEAIRMASTGEPAVALPDTPGRPEHELAWWCAAEIRRLRASRSLILQCLAEEPTHPGLAHAGVSPLASSAAELNRYVTLLLKGRAIADMDRKAAVTMLLAALYSDALGRTTLPTVHALDASSAPTHYVRMFLRALGIVGTEDGSSAGHS